MKLHELHGRVTHQTVLQTEAQIVSLAMRELVATSLSKAVEVASAVPPWCRFYFSSVRMHAVTSLRALAE